MARKKSPKPQPEPVPQAQSPSELIMQEELTRAKEEKVCEEFAINRTYRRIALKALTDGLSSGLGDDRVDLGVLSTVVRAVELHSFTMVLLAFDGRSVTFVRQGISDITMFLQWCHSFFSQTAMMAPSMPAPQGGADTLQKVLAANTAELRQLIEHIGESSKFSEDEGAASDDCEASGEACEDAVTFTLGTFSALANALMSVVRALLPPKAFSAFNNAYGGGLVELRDLRELMVGPPNEPADDNADAIPATK